MIRIGLRELLIGERLDAFVLYSSAAALLTVLIVIEIDVGLHPLFVSSASGLFPSLESSIVGFVPITFLLGFSTYLAYTNRGWATCMIVTSAGMHVLHRSPFNYIGEIGFLSSGVGEYLWGIVAGGFWFATATFVIGFGLRVSLIRLRAQRTAREVSHQRLKGRLIRLHPEEPVDLSTRLSPRPPASPGSSPCRRRPPSTSPG